MKTSNPFMTPTREEQERVMRKWEEATGGTGMPSQEERHAMGEVVATMVAAIIVITKGHSTALASAIEVLKGWLDAARTEAPEDFRAFTDKIVELGRVEGLEVVEREILAPAYATESSGMFGILPTPGRNN